MNDKGLPLKASDNDEDSNVHEEDLVVLSCEFKRLFRKLKCVKKGTFKFQLV